jgi:hypothetical protein
MINQRKERKQQLLKDHQKIIQERESAKKLKLEKKETHLDFKDAQRQVKMFLVCISK